MLSKQTAGVCPQSASTSCPHHATPSPGLCSSRPYFLFRLFDFHPSFISSQNLLRCFSLNSKPPTWLTVLSTPGACS